MTSPAPRRTPGPEPTPAGEPVPERAAAGRPVTSRVSVIVPNFNKARTLGACLASVHRQTLPPVEVIVVDDASTDDSRTVAARFACTLLVFPVNRGVSAARNAGAAAAGGDILFFLDSDVELAPDALANAVSTLRKYPDCAVVQGIYDSRPLFDDGPVEVYKTLFEHYWRRQTVGPAAATLFALTAVHRKVFDRVGGFDESLRDTEDVEFGSRLPPEYEIRTSGEVVGRHDDVDRLRPYLREHVRRAGTYGALLAGRLLAPAAVPTTGGPRAEPGDRPAAGAGGRPSRRVDVAAVTGTVSCAAAVVTAPLAAVTGWLLVVPAALVVVFLVVDSPLFRFVRRERGRRFLAYFVAMHFLMHASEFAGLLAGAVRGTVAAAARAVRPTRAASGADPVRTGARSDPGGTDRRPLRGRP